MKQNKPCYICKESAKEGVEMERKEKGVVHIETVCGHHIGVVHDYDDLTYRNDCRKESTKE